jgi:hypothetical protein
MGKINNNDKLSKQLLPLTETEESVLLGTLLGDGHLQKKGPTSSRLKIGHSIKQQGYVMWKYNKLKRLCQTVKPPEITDGENPEIGFYTSGGKYLDGYHKLLYKPVEEKTKDNKIKIRYVKTITQELIDRLPVNPIVLAVLYMDDGSPRTDSYAARISTQAFSLEENNLLVQYFEKCGISGVKVVYHDKAREIYCLYIPATNNVFANFISYIEPIVREVPELAYKLNEKYKPRND